MLRCGLLGEKLGHSYSAQIHAMLGGYEYKMYEKSHEEVMEFLKGGDWDALNVTIRIKSWRRRYAMLFQKRQQASVQLIRL